MAIKANSGKCMTYCSGISRSWVMLGMMPPSLIEESPVDGAVVSGRVPANGWCLLRSLLVLVSLCGVTALVGQPKLSMASTAADDQWREEILLELSELRKSQGEIQKRVGDLTAEVAQLKAMHAKSAGALSMDLRNASFPSLGNADAPLVIVEFSDFQCPYCRLHQKNTLPALVDKYVSTGKSKYVMVDFPLGF